jgi:hypothetical protein
MNTNPKATSLPVETQQRKTVSWRKVADTRTPGPWYVQSAANGSAVTVRATNGATVATLKSDHPDTKGRKLANARLLAAAPELYAALEGVLRVADRATDEFEAARAALARCGELA